MTPPDGSLAGKVAIVTGAGYGIGRGIAIRLAEESAIVIVNYGHSRAAALESVRQIRGLGGRAIPVRADVSREAEVNALVAKALEVRGAIDVLINNAGLVGRTRLLDLEEAEWDRIVGVNLKGA